MFSKSNSDDTTRKEQALQERNRAPGKPQGGPSAPSIIGSDIKINGNLSTAGELQLDGVIEGDVSCGALTLGEHGQIKGSIASDSVVIRGKVEGTIRARNVRLEKTCKVLGDVTHETVSVEAGAHIEGKFIHTNGAGKTQSASPSADKPVQSPQQAAPAKPGGQPAQAQGGGTRRESLLGG